MNLDYVEGHYDSDEERRKQLDWDSYYGKHGIAGVYGQDKVKCQPFSTSSPEAFDPLRRIKVELKSLLITSGPLTAEQILIEFRDTFDFDIEDHGFSAVQDLLSVMPDVVVESKDGYGNIIYIANTNEKSADINSLIQRTKAPISPSKRSHRMPCSTGLTRGTSIPRTSATVSDIQPKFQRYRMSWLADRVASTKTIGNFPCRPRKDPRPLLGNGPRSEERCVMVMDMVREIGQPSPDGVEIRVHLENLVNFYYKETGVCLLGKIFSFEQYVDEMQHRDFARFWRVMFDSPPGKDTLVFIVVPAVGLYPAPDPANAVDVSETSPHDSSTVDDSYEDPTVEQAEEVNTAETVPAQAPRISPAGLRIISHTVRSVVNSNLRDCDRRGNDMPCNRLPMSREDLHARRVTPPPEEAPYEEKEAPVVENVAPASVKPIEHLEERHLEWMKVAKVIENVRVEGANLFASMRFVPPRSMLLTALWGNHNYERFNFIENQLRAFAQIVNLTPVSILHLGQEYVTRSEGRLGRAIFVKHCDGDLFSFVLLDYHAHVKVPRSCVFEMPSIFSSSSLPSNTFLATIRGIESIPTSRYEALDGIITPEDGSLTPELQIGEIFNIDQGETRLADWICALNTDLWFSDCCLQEGAIPTFAAPKKVSFELLRKSIEFLKQEAGFTFDPEMEVIVFRTPSVMSSENANSISQISSQLESLQIDKNVDENDTSAQGNKRAVRFSDQPDDLFHYTLEAETGSQNSTASSMLIHDEASVESDPGVFSVRVRSLLKFFFVLHNGGEMIDRPFDVKKFTFTVFQSMVKDPLHRQYALSKFAAVLYHYKSLWMDPSDQHSLDIVASTVNDWISADL